MPELSANQPEKIVGKELDLNQGNETTPTQTTSVTPPASTTTPTPTSSVLRPMTSQPSAKPSFFRRRKKILLGLGIPTVIICLLLLALAVYTFTIVKTVQAQAQEAATIGRTALDKFKAQDLPGAEESLKQLQTKTVEIRSTYDKLAFYKAVPVARGYYIDGEHGFNAADAGLSAALKTVAAVTPYADVLGFSGEGTFEGGTAENRVKLMLQTLEKITPVLDDIGADLETAEAELAHIDENDYPESFRGVPVRSYIEEGKTGVSNAATVLEDYRPILEFLPEIAGAGEERKKYLVLFQNDNELRPTGGFLTAYSVIFMENGVVTPEKSDDIYELDKKFNERIPIPEALGRYLTTERYWNLRDMNTSPDFKTSMEQFFEYYQDVPGEPDNIDGIIAVDTHLLNDLVRIVGPIEVPGYGTFSAEDDPRCDCPQIIYALSEIITRPTPYIREDRKGILAPLMQSIITRIYASPRVFMADLFQAGLDSVNGRHLQAYFLNEEYQSATEAINAAGRLTNEGQAEDFLAIVNANLGGAKSNLFVEYDVAQEVSAPENGQITKTVEITYRNPRHADNCNLEAGLLCLNSTLRDWTRLYLPEGSQLIEAQGFTETAKEYDEAGFHVIDGFFILEPKGQAKLRVTYTVPYTDTETYTVKLWKQGGVDPIVTVMDVNGGQEEIVVETDTVYSAPF